MRKPKYHDSQRSRVYAWERRASNNFKDCARFESLEDVETFLAPIWRSERGRVGRAKRPMPTISRNLWGQRRATGHAQEIKLPKWARSDWVILHEATHGLVPQHQGGWHGPRFVGVLIGLLARHCGRDANELMALADEMGVKYHVRSVGVVPVIPLWRKLLPLLPIGYMDAATELDVSYRQVNGAALHLIRNGMARWRGRTLVGVTP